MREVDDFVIDAPYEITPEDATLISQASPFDNNSEDWEKTCLSGFKDRIRRYYLKKQNRRCAYCRTVIRISQASSEIEHIVPKSFNPRWMYEPFNLCLSCKICNTKKSTKSVLDTDESQKLPKLSEEYLLVHPHIDKYSEHIRIIEDVLYEGLTEKGQDTIRICELDRYELAADRAEDILKSERPLSERFLLSLVQHQGHCLVNVYSEFEERVHELFQEYNRADRSTVSR